MIRIPEPHPALDWSSANTFSVNDLDRRSDARTDPAFVARAFDDPHARLMVFFGDRIVIDGTPPRPYLTGGALDDIAQREERSMSDVIRELLRTQVQQRLFLPTGAPRP